MHACPRIDCPRFAGIPVEERFTPSGLSSMDEAARMKKRRDQIEACGVHYQDTWSCVWKETEMRSERYLQFIKQYKPMTVLQRLQPIECVRYGKSSAIRLEWSEDSRKSENEVFRFIDIVSCIFQ